MNIKFSMPELLVLFSLFMYSQSFTFAIVAFTLGLLGRIIVYIMDYSVEMKQAESAKESVNEAVDAFASIFNGNKKEI